MKTSHTPGPLKLTSSDASEIYYAVCSKIAAIKRGAYNPEDEAGQNKDWINHLRKIQNKIGVDGINLIAK